MAEANMKNEVFPLCVAQSIVLYRSKKSWLTTSTKMEKGSRHFMFVCCSSNEHFCDLYFAGKMCSLDKSSETLWQGRQKYL